MTVFEDALNRLATKYNGNAYNSSTNTGGLDGGGHTINFVPALQDMATAGEGVADLADTAVAAAATATTKASEASTSAGLAATAKTAAETARDEAQATVLPLGGECRLDYTSTTVLTLSRYNGHRLVIDNVARSIPAAGVTLANPGVANTKYFIYAYWTGSAIALEYNATGHSPDSRNGVRTKTGDVTRTLVGMAKTNASGQWVLSATQVYVISWYNQRQIIGKYVLASTFSTASPSFVATGATLDFLCWGLLPNDVGITTWVKNNIANAGSFTSATIDGVDVLTALNNSHVSSFHSFASPSALVPLAEGSHTLVMRVYVSNGTGDWYAGNTFVTVNVSG